MGISDGHGKLGHDFGQLGLEFLKGGTGFFSIFLMSDEHNVNHIQEGNVLSSKYIPDLIVKKKSYVTDLPNICLLTVGRPRIDWA